MNLATGKKQPVPRHIEIDNDLVKHIRKYLGLMKLNSVLQEEKNKKGRILEVDLI